MPIYDVQHNGANYEVEAPDDEHFQTALSAIRQSQPGAPTQGEDIGKSLVSGVGRGTVDLAGLPGDAAGLLNRGTDWALSKIGLQQDTPTDYNLGTSHQIQGQVEKATGPFYQPQTPLGHYAETVGEFLPGSLAGGGSVVGNLLRYGVLPGVASEAAGQAASAYPKYEPYARAAAGTLASVLNPARLVTPNPISSTRQAALQTLENEGVASLSAGQKTGNKSLQYLESAASHAPGAGGAASRIEHEGQQQFTEAALRRAGAGPDATPEVLAANKKRLGQSFDSLSARNTLIPDNQFINDVVDAARNYRRVPDSQQRQMVQGYIDDILGHVNNGQMPGPEYQEMRSRLGRQAKGLQASDPTLSDALRDMRNALDGAMARSISPADQAAWQQTRSEYGAQKVIAKAASRAGEATAEGQITPANLRNTVAADNREGYAIGQGPFNKLARAGVQVMTPLPSSGTAERANAFHLLNAAMFGIPQAVGGRVLMSAPVQSYLANQLIHGAPMTNEARTLNLARMLMAQEQPKIEGEPTKVYISKSANSQ